jgi:hypothetical protein
MLPPDLKFMSVRGILVLAMLLAVGYVGAVALYLLSYAIVHTILKLLEWLP